MYDTVQYNFPLAECILSRRDARVLMSPVAEVATSTNVMDTFDIFSTDMPWQEKLNSLMHLAGSIGSTGSTGKQAESKKSGPLQRTKALIEVDISVSH